MGWRRRLAGNQFSIAKRRKRRRRCPAFLEDASDSKLSSSPHGHLRISCLLTVFVSWRWVARVASGSERVTRQTRAGREVTSFTSSRCDVPRDGSSGEDVVRDVVELGTIFISCSTTSVSRHILRSPRVPASSAAATRARRETPYNITRDAPRDGTRLEDAHFSNLMHLRPAF